MASHEIVVAGVPYVRSREAARVVQRAPDYISTLARGGLVLGTRVDGLWFINLASLKDFVAEQQRQKEAWRARLATLRREEQRLAGHPSALTA